MIKNKSKIKDIAYNYVFRDASHQLQVWWSHHFSKPLFHDILSEYTEDELLLEFYIFKFIDNEQFLAEYEKEQGIADEEKKDDEEWFKKQMGREYVGKAKKDEEVHDVY